MRIDKSLYDGALQQTSGFLLNCSAILENEPLFILINIIPLITNIEIIKNTYMLCHDGCLFLLDLVGISLHVSCTKWEKVAIKSTHLQIAKLLHVQILFVKDYLLHNKL